MKSPSTRRAFLADVGRGALIASLGPAVAGNLGLSAGAEVLQERATLEFGPLEPLVRLLQETPADRVLPVIVRHLRDGVDLRTWVAAGALANARTFGGEDYVGFHTLMALSPAYHMAMESPAELRALPVLKVLYRNTQRIQERGGRRAEVLHPVEGAPIPEGRPAGQVLQEAVRRKDIQAAEQVFATASRGSPEAAFNHLLMAVQDHTEVHRVVLPYRAWDLLGIIGKEQAHTLLRQSVRYCVNAEPAQRAVAADEPRAILPRLLEEHHLLEREPGTRALDAAAVSEIADTIFVSTPAQAAGAVASALAEGIAPGALGEAITLAANQLILRDAGRTAREEQPGKVIGSVHGDSIGVHAMDSANAWRNMARMATPRNTVACLILGAYQVARDRIGRGGDFLHWQPLPVARHLDEIRSTQPDGLLRELDEAVRGNLQARACAIVQRCAILEQPHRPIFELLLKYATSEDGSLHGEKFFRTVSEEFATTRPEFRWRHLVALARVTASEFGRPAAGMSEARELLTAS